MEGAPERRKRLIDILSASSNPLTGSELAGLLGVTRQIIVQDIAILRARGERIISTPQGYLMASAFRDERFTRTFACRHQPADIEAELQTIVDNGGNVIDVTVEHPIYGELRGLLMVKSRHDVRRFVDNMNRTGAKPLSSLTKGVHLHTVEAESPEVFERIEEALAKMGFLLEKS